MDKADAVKLHFQRQADACEGLGSPFTSRLCRLAADNIQPTGPVWERILYWPGDPKADALALRLMGALHGLVLGGKDSALVSIYPPGEQAVENDADVWGIIDAAVGRHEDTVLDWLASPPQTNEVARAGMIMPALMWLAGKFGKPLSLFEIGSSAGLMLNLDKFFYDFGGVRAGDPSSPVRLAPDVKGNLPAVSCLPAVASVRGCDQRPIDVLDESATLRLHSYIWPEQLERHQRLDGAIALFRENPPRLDASDAADWVEARVENLPSGSLSVFFHTIVWQYLPEKTTQRIETAIHNAGASGNPVALLGMDAFDSSHAALTLRLWSGHGADEGKELCLANVDYHGRWIEWLP